MTEEYNPTLSIKICWVSVFLVAIISIMLYIKTDYHPMIAFVSPLIIAIISLLIAWFSEKRMVVISRADIIGIIRAMERARFNFFNKIHKFEKELDELKGEKNQQKIERLMYEGIQILEIATWESIRCLRQTNIMRKWAKQEDKDDMANGMHILIYNIFLFKPMNIVLNRHVRQLLLGCQELSKLGISESWKTRIVCLLQKNDVGEMKPGDKNFEGYIEKKLKQIDIDPSGILSREQFMSVPFKSMN